ncbi:hypothetical protein SAMN04515666_103600 [Bosea lupini]|uniref:Uncharacterized protein n=1 Tax=Bosea lupini TaxID=1036779 RepID=A0A1H7PTW7_9HYPH|nr:hypothetical protein [Bosea lupini]SEL38908.1 hypothetical protein SAMN04515666_103600 [Bosea lupini]
MAQAVERNSTPAPSNGTGFSPLSSLFRDPALRRAFERAERDDGAAFAVPAPKPAPISGGALKVLEDA